MTSLQLQVKNAVFQTLQSYKLKEKAQNSSSRTLPLELRSVMLTGAEENQAHCCDPHGQRVQEQPLFLVCSNITIFTSMGLDP